MLVHVIDDEASVAHLVCEFLRREGFETEKFTSAATYIAHQVTVVPDLIITDLLLPNVDGFKLCETVRRHPRLKQVPIIAMTALTWRTDGTLSTELMQRFGVVTVLQKPFTKHGLLEAVRKVFGKRWPAPPSPDQTVGAPPPSAKTASALVPAQAAAARQKSSGPVEPVSIKDATNAPFMLQDSARKALRFPVRFKSSDAFQDEYTKNISAGGMFIQTQTPPAVFSEVVIEMELPDGQPPLELKGAVVHATAGVGFGLQLSKPSAEVIARWQKLLKQPDREAAVSLLPNAAVCVPLGVGEAAMGELWRLVGLLWRETVVVEPLQKWSEVLRLERVDVVLIDTRQERGHWFGESDLGALARRHPNARVIVYGPAPEGISESISPPVTVVEKGPTERLVARLADWLCVQTRTSIRVPVKLAGEVDGMAVQVIDLSVTGARIAMRKGFVPGSDVTLELVLDETKLQLSCLVRWCRDTPGQVQAGLSFEQVQAEALDVIGRYVDGKALLFRTVSAVRRKAEEPS